MERKRTIEELFGCHCEELGLVFRAIGVEECFVALLGEAAQPQKFVGAHGHPFGQLAAIGEERGTVGSSVEHVELVGELVVDHVAAIRWVHTSVVGVGP